MSRLAEKHVNTFSELALNLQAKTVHALAL
jgi:hypothetical protein